MGKITVSDLAGIRNEASHQMTVRQGIGRAKITVHMGTCGIAAGARGILLVVMEEIERRGLDDVLVTNAGCAGSCSSEPMMKVDVANESAPVEYILLTPDKVRKIIESHVVNGHAVREYALGTVAGKSC